MKILLLSLLRIYLRSGQNEQKMGKVWFTVSVGAYEAGAEPTPGGVAARLMGITTATVLTGGLLGIGIVGGASGITSSMGVKKDGVYAVSHTRPCVRVRVDTCTHAHVRTHTNLHAHAGLPLPRRSRGAPR